MKIFTTKKSEKAELEKVLSYLNSIDSINCGGCGVSALAIYRWLIKNNLQTKTTKFVYFHSNDCFYENNKNYLNGNGGTPDSCSHVVIYHKGKYIDSEGILDRTIEKRYKRKLIIRSEDFVVESVNNIERWNDDFDREKEIPKIMKRLKIDLSDIDLKFYY